MYGCEIICFYYELVVYFYIVYVFEICEVIFIYRHRR
jgi:hypothetical protein